MRARLYRDGVITRCQSTIRSGARCQRQPRWVAEGAAVCGNHLRPGAVRHPEATEELEAAYRG